MKILVRIFAYILLLLALIVGAAAALLGTPGGLGWLVEQTDAAIPGRLSIASIEGGLFGRLHLKQVSYSDDAMQATADELILHWLPMALLERRLHLREFTLLGPAYTQLKATEPDPADPGPLSLPDIALPMELRLDRVTVERLRFRAAADAEPVELTRLLLAADWNTDGIALDNLELEMPGIAVSAGGTVRPQGNYPLDLRTTVSLALPDLPRIDARGRIHGDLQRLMLEQELDGDLRGSLSASADDPLGELGWQADLELASFLLRSLAPDTEGRLAGRLKASGDLKQLQVEGEIRLEEAEAFFAPWHTDLQLTANLEKQALSIQRLAVTRPETPLELTLSGSADRQLNLDIQGAWKSLHWPPSGVAQFSSGSGSLDLKGTHEDYRLNLQASVAGTDLPHGEWEISGHGNQERFQISKLEGKTLDGTLGAEGSLGWAPAPHWDLALKARGINPGVQYPEWPGRLDLVLSSKGGIEGGKPNLSAVIDTLKGELRERALHGMGTVRVVGEEITLDEVKLSSGSAVVHANGRLGDKSDLAWEIGVSDLADLLPDAAGSVQGKGTVSGSMTEPGVNGSLSAKDVSFRDLAVQTLAADLALDLSDQQASKVDLQSSNIRIGGEKIPSLQLQGDGRRKDHRLSASLKHAMASLSLELVGAYDDAAGAWKGSLADLGIQSRDFGAWLLKQPVGIAAAPDDLRLDELCLTRDGGSVCARGTLRKGKGKASLKADGLQLSWLRSFLPPALERLEGAIGLQADATLGDKPLADAVLTIGAGEIVVRPPGEALITLAHQGGQLNARFDDRQLAADFNLGFGEDGLKGRINLPRGPLDKDHLSAPLDGDIDIRFRQLGLFAGLVPVVQKLSGEFLVGLQLGGTLGQPSVKGDAALTMQQLQIPDAGLDLKDIEVKARSDDGRHVRLDGGISSGQGRLVLKGDLELDAGKNWPMQISMKGTDFQALNLPDKTALIITDLAFSSGAEGRMLRGSVDIPHAYIVLEDIPEGSTSPSSDVIIETGEGSQAEPEMSAPFAMHVTVGLGDDVQFRGMGLKAYFTGKLTVNKVPEEFPTGSGELRIKEGTYRAYGQNLSIDRGIVSYSGGRIDNPGLNVRAARTASVDLGRGDTQVKAGVDVTGSAKKPKITVFSDPAMEERDAISILLTGTIASNIGKAGGSIGLGTHQVSKDLSVGARYEPSSSKTEIVTKYRFNRKIHVEATTSSEGNAADVFYSLEFD